MLQEPRLLQHFYNGLFAICHLSEDPSNGIAASGGRTAIVYQYFFLLYSLGVHPNCFLKLVEKWERVLKPVI